MDIIEKLIYLESEVKVTKIKSSLIRYFKDTFEEILVKNGSTLTRIIHK